MRDIETRGSANIGWRYKVVELAGQIQSLVCLNPWAGPCTNPKCFVCTTGGRGTCSRPGCTYKVQCLTCKERGPDTVPDEEEQGEGRPGQGEVGVPCTALYHGYSGYSAYTRGLDHQKDLVSKKKTNALWRHSLLYHNSEQVPYQMSVVSNHNEPVGRKLREGVDIVLGNQTILLNSKEEFLQGAVPTTRTQRGFG